MCGFIKGHIWGHLGTIGVIWEQLGLFGNHWGHLGTVGVIWEHLGPFGNILGHLGTFGVKFWVIWGQVWENLGSSLRSLGVTFGVKCDVIWDHVGWTLDLWV